MNAKMESAARSRNPCGRERRGRLAAGFAGRSAQGRLRDAAIDVGLLVAPTAAVALIGRSSLAALGMVLLGKVSAVYVMRASSGLRRDATRSQRVVLVEAITLGAIVALVACLSLGRNGAMPRSLLLLDWAATLAAIALVRGTGKEEPEAEESRPVAEPAPLPEVVASVRDRVVLLQLPPGPIGSELIDRIEALKPSGWIISGGDPVRIDRLGPNVIRLDDQLSGLREVFARKRPDIAIRMLDRNAGDETGQAVATRKLANEALRVGVASLVLVTPQEKDVAESSFSDRIVGALSGLTNSRLVRIRLADDVEDGNAARRILRIAAKGRDGTIVNLSKTGGSCLEGLGGRGDAEQLWAELDRT